MGFSLRLPFVNLSSRSMTGILSSAVAGNWCSFCFLAILDGKEMVGRGLPRLPG